MDINECKSKCHLFVEFFAGNINISIFGSIARVGEGKDLDLLFEVSPEVFGEYRESCDQAAVDFLSGEPHYPRDYCWAYHSPQKMRLFAFARALNIDETPLIQIAKIFRGHVLDVIMLPFGWRNDQHILTAVNSQDKNFADSLKEDMRLLFSRKA